MENKINIAELLKDCPTGMELDCVMYEDCRFLDVDTKGNSYLIRITTPCGIKYLDKYGCYTTDNKAKCIIFPKGKTTWEGFHRPFKDGDIVYNRLQKRICIYHHVEDKISCINYCRYNEDHKTFEILHDYIYIAEQDYRLATKEEKEKLFQAIKDNGYKWNADTKTLDKLIEPSFKVGDKVRHKNNHGVVFTITSIEEDSYVCGAKAAFWFDDQDDYELVPNKFDITTLKPFDKVLSRDNDFQKWGAELFSFYNKETKDYRFQLVGAICARRCIPFEGNQHLLGTTDDCDEYYKTWINEEE